MDQETGRRLTVYLRAQRNGAYRVLLHFDPGSDGWTASAAIAGSLAEGWELALHAAKLEEVPDENIMLVHQPALPERARPGAAQRLRARLPRPDQPPPTLVFYLSPGTATGFVLDVERFGRRRRLIDRIELADKATLSATIKALCAREGALAYRLVDLTLAGDSPAPDAAAPEARRAARLFRSWLGRLSPAKPLVGAAILAMITAATYAFLPDGPAPAPAAVSAARPPPGLGFSRGPVVRTLTLFDYGIQPDTDGRDQPRWRAQSPLGVAEIIGPDENLTGLTLLLRETHDPDGQQQAGEQLAALFEIAFPRWKGGRTWLAQALQSGAGRIVRDGKEAHVDRIKDVGVMLSVGLPETQVTGVPAAKPERVAAERSVARP